MANEVVPPVELGTVEYEGRLLRVMRGVYPQNGRAAVMLEEVLSGEPWGKVSINVPSVPGIGDDEFILNVDNVSNGVGLLGALVVQGFVAPTPRLVAYGQYTGVPVFQVRKPEDRQDDGAGIDGANSMAAMLTLGQMVGDERGAQRDVEALQAIMDGEEPPKGGPQDGAHLFEAIGPSGFWPKGEGESELLFERSRDYVMGLTFSIVLAINHAENLSDTMGGATLTPQQVAIRIAQNANRILAHGPYPGAVTAHPSPKVTDDGRPIILLFCGDDGVLSKVSRWLVHGTRVQTASIFDAMPDVAGEA